MKKRKPPGASGAGASGKAGAVSGKESGRGGPRQRGPSLRELIAAGVVQPGEGNAFLTYRDKARGAARAGMPKSASSPWPLRRCQLRAAPRLTRAACALRTRADVRGVHHCRCGAARRRRHAVCHALCLGAALQAAAAAGQEDGRRVPQHQVRRADGAHAGGAEAAAAGAVPQRGCAGGLRGCLSRGVRVACAQSSADARCVAQQAAQQATAAAAPDGEQDALRRIAALERMLGDDAAPSLDDDEAMPDATSP